MEKERETSICAGFNLIEHEIGACPVKRYPCVESGIAVCFDLFRDILLHVQRLPWLADLWIAVTQFCQDATQRVEDMVFIVSTVLLEATDKRLRCINGSLETERVSVTGVGAGKVGIGLLFPCWFQMRYHAPFRAVLPLPSCGLCAQALLPYSSERLCVKWFKIA